MPSLAVVAFVAGSLQAPLPCSGLGLNFASRPLQIQSFVDGHRRHKTSCTQLDNRITHFTVDVEVGTPRQRFSVVADTGSNSLIVPSCDCNKFGACSADARCFTGVHRSSSFAYDRHLKPLTLTFGSGTIEARLVTELVRIGETKVNMSDGILLMVDHALNIGSNFEGILGLGIPLNEADIQKLATSQDTALTMWNLTDSAKKLGALEKRNASRSGDGRAALRRLGVPFYVMGVEEPLGESGVSVIERPPQGNDTLVSRVKKHQRAGLRIRASHSEKAVAPRSFLEQARIQRFSMCFNYNEDGVLRFNERPQRHSLGTVGKVHWSLGFEGVTVGNQQVSVPFCRKRDMVEGQETPCGAIPDSGTTAIMAPAEHIELLLSAICDGWTRCKRQHAIEMKKGPTSTSYSAEDTRQSKVTTVNNLLMDCSSWLHEFDGLDELPQLSFHVAGHDGKKDTLVLPGWSYVIESMVDTGGNNGMPKRFCQPFFSPMSYSTERNGPVWIFGTAFFYRYKVSFDLQATPPSIAFNRLDKSRGGCGSCQPESTFFFRVPMAKQNTLARMPHHINGTWRKPNLNLQLPL